jgi:hypothetical protein
MIDVYNTTFEVSLRVLFTLAVAECKMSADMIAVSDFLTVYGRDFGLSDENLHGDNSYRFGEFAVRREVVGEAVKELVLKAFITADSTSEGFVYAIHQRGREYIDTFDNEYARLYCGISAKVRDYLHGASVRKVLRLINERSMESLQRRSSDV